VSGYKEEGDREGQRGVNARLGARVRKINGRAWYSCNTKDGGDYDAVVDSPVYDVARNVAGGGKLHLYIFRAVGSGLLNPARAGS